jgi:hypothetical protein
MPEPEVELSKLLHRKYENPSMLDIRVGVQLLYVNMRRFTSGEKNRPGQEPVFAHIEVSKIDAGPDGDEVTIAILHEGPTRTLKLPITALVSVADIHVHRMPNGDRIHFFIDKMQKRN